MDDLSFLNLLKAVHKLPYVKADQYYYFMYLKNQITLMFLGISRKS